MLSRAFVLHAEQPFGVFYTLRIKCESSSWHGLYYTDCKLSSTGKAAPKRGAAVCVQSIARFMRLLEVSNT